MTDMDRWLLLIVLGILFDGPAFLFVWWRLWQWRTMEGLSGSLALAMSLMALGHVAFTALSVIAWLQPPFGFSYSPWFWLGRMALSLPLWWLGFVLLRNNVGRK